jgi:hypothetical protein
MAAVSRGESSWDIFSATRTFAGKALSSVSFPGATVLLTAGILVYALAYAVFLRFFIEHAPPLNGRTAKPH